MRSLLLLLLLLLMLVRMRRLLLLLLLLCKARRSGVLLYLSRRWALLGEMGSMLCHKRSVSLQPVPSRRRALSGALTRDAGPRAEEPREERYDADAVMAE